MLQFDLVLESLMITEDDIATEGILDKAKDFGGKVKSGAIAAGKKIVEIFTKLKDMIANFLKAIKNKFKKGIKFKPVKDIDKKYMGQAKTLAKLVTVINTEVNKTTKLLTKVDAYSDKIGAQADKLEELANKYTEFIDKLPEDAKAVVKVNAVGNKAIFEATLKGLEELQTNLTKVISSMDAQYRDGEQTKEEFKDAYDNAIKAAAKIVGCSNFIMELTKAALAQVETVEEKEEDASTDSWLDLF